MNEHEDDIAEFFARAAEPAYSDEFAAGIKRKVASQRLHTKVRAVGVAALLALLVVLATFVIPPAWLYPIRIAQELLMSLGGMAASLLAALALTCWLRFVDS